MPCTGCQKAKARIRTERQALDAKTTATLSEAVAVTRKDNPDLSARLMALVGEINALGLKERSPIVEHDTE